MRTIKTAERRARLGFRHRLAAPVATVDEVPEAVVGLHSSDPVTVFLSARARTRRFEVTDLEDALYERRTLLRMLGMRRTMFVVPRETAPIVDAACTKALAAGERRRLVRMLEEAGIAQPGRGGRWLARVERATLEALRARGEATARQLSSDVPELRRKLTFGEGRAWAGTMGMSTRVLFLLATEGRIIRGRPLGSWVSGQYRWAPIEGWLGAPLEAIDHAEARAALLRRYLRSFGPATSTDIRWWTGWTVTVTASTLDAIGAVQVGLEEGIGFVAPGDERSRTSAEPWAAFLPGLDPTTMGWKERGWYLGPRAPMHFDRAGNAGPTVWLDGRVVGAWTQVRDGRILVELLERVPRPAARLIDEERQRLEAWFGGVRISPRFRTPLERRLEDGA